MIISQTAEYALRAAVLLSTAEGGSMTTQQIAEASRIPPDYLSKILQNLRRAGVVTSLRGVRGGFVLSRPASQLTILEVVNAIDPIERIHSCPLKLETHGTNLCPLHRKLDQAIATVEQAFGNSTLAEVAKPSQASQPLCDALSANTTPERKRGK